MRFTISPRELGGCLRFDVTALAVELVVDAEASAAQKLESAGSHERNNAIPLVDRRLGPTWRHDLDNARSASEMSFSVFYQHATEGTAC
jgi:hypothetical protein